MDWTGRKLNELIIKLINKIYDQVLLILLGRQINDRLAVKFLEVVSQIYFLHTLTANNES